jgi:hypothetical protein
LAMPKMDFAIAYDPDLDIPPHRKIIDHPKIFLSKKLFVGKG